MMTEDEARTKVCPHLPVDREIEPVNNVQADRVFKWSCCIASACMAWRWVRTDELTIPEGAPIPDQYYSYATMRSTTRGVETLWQVCRLRLRSADGAVLLPFRGFCGLAGTPQ